MKFATLASSALAMIAATAAATNNWNLLTVYPGNGCSSANQGQLSYYAQYISQQCTELQCVNFKLAGTNFSESQACPSSMPNIIVNGVYLQYYKYSSSSCEASTATDMEFVPASGTCSIDVTQTTDQVTKYSKYTCNNDGTYNIQSGCSDAACSIGCSIVSSESLGCQHSDDNSYYQYVCAGVTQVPPSTQPPATSDPTGGATTNGATSAPSTANGATSAPSTAAGSGAGSAAGASASSTGAPTSASNSNSNPTSATINNQPNTAGGSNPTTAAASDSSAAIAPVVFTVLIATVLMVAFATL